MVAGNRKQQLFDKFSQQLSLLKENGLLDIELAFNKTYICPICLRQFSEEALVADGTMDFLTEEDAPPASLGGTRIALTCKRCNSECGHKIDFQLKELLEYDENRRFVPGKAQFGTIDFQGKPVTVQIVSEGGGQLKAIHKLKTNNPQTLKAFIASVKSGSTLVFNHKRHRLDSRKINYAILKTNYIITFSKFGYIFLLDPAYDIIRRQILHPEEKFISHDLSVYNNDLRPYVGTHYVLTPKLKGIFNIFSLATKFSQRTYGAFLPVPTIPLPTFVQEARKRTQGQSLLFDKSNYDASVDLFTDVASMRKIKTWATT